MTDYTKLKQLAEAAAPIETDLCEYRHFDAYYSRADLTKQQDDYLTAATPATILQMIEEIESLKRDAGVYRFLKTNHCTYGNSYGAIDKAMEEGK